MAVVPLRKSAGYQSGSVFARTREAHRNSHNQQPVLWYRRPSCALMSSQVQMVPFCILGSVPRGGRENSILFNWWWMRSLDQHAHGALMASAPHKTSITSQIIAAENPRSFDCSSPPWGKARSRSAHEPIFSFVLHTTAEGTGRGEH